MADDVLGRPALRRLWDLVAERLQRNGMRPVGTVVLGGLDRDERHAMAGVLGRPVPGDRVRVDLAALDLRLRTSGLADGLVGAVRSRRGPLVDRLGERVARRDARQAVWHAGRAALDDAGLGVEPWVEPWLEDLRRAGALGRLPPDRAEAVLMSAVTCIRELPLRTGNPPVARVDLASRIAGTAHALDDGRTLASLVLRAVAAMTGRPYPTTAIGRRELWRAAGVLSDQVSTTVLTVGLRSGTGDTWLDHRSDAGWETHLTPRDLRRLELRAPSDGQAFVCENPRVLEAAIDRRAARAMVCTQGQPAFVVVTLLRVLAGLGTTLRYHGDFDWAGIAIANRMIGDAACLPWRMAAGDYAAALARLAPVVGELPLLSGAPVDAVWDVHLAPAMTGARRIVHEELVIETLLADVLDG